MSTNKTKLVRLAAALALLGTASFGAMAEWTQVTENPDIKAYVDFNTIRRSGHMVKMWTLNDEKSRQTSPSGSYLSMRSRDEYDCSDERKRKLDLSVHVERMAGGSVLYTDSTIGQWTSIAPGSIAARFFEAACGIK